MFFRIIVRVSDSRCRYFEEGSHVNTIFPRDGVEEEKGLHGHHVAGLSIIGINGMVNLDQFVAHFMWQLIYAAKLRTALKFLNRIEENLDSLHGIIHHDRKILGLFLLILVGL